MILKKILAAFVLTVLAASVTAAEDVRQAFVKIKDGTTLKASSITADDAGNLTCDSGKSPKSLIKRKDYIFAQIPKPPEIIAAEALLAKRDYNGAAAAFAGTANSCKYLSWFLYSLNKEAEALLLAGKKAEAEKVLVELSGNGVKIPDSEMDAYYKGLQKLYNLYSDGGKQEQAAAVLDTISKSTEENYSAYAFIAKGDAFMKKNMQKDALLEYFKVVLMYPVSNKQRAEALCKTANTLKLLGDSKSAVYADMLKKEYPGSEFIKNLK